MTNYKIQLYAFVQTWRVQRFKELQVPFIKCQCFQAFFKNPLIVAV